MKKIKLCVLMVCFLMPFAVNSQAPFKSGNIVVVRLGDGSAIDPANPTLPMFLDEYTLGGALVQSIALPTVDNGSNLRMSQVFFNGDASFLTLSPNKQFLTLVGFTASPGTSSSGIASASFNRTVASVDYNGAINSSTSIKGTDISSGATGFPISAITDDGTRFWVVHDAVNGGIRYALLGQSTSANIITSGSIRTLDISGGQLYCTRASRPNTVNGGLPTSGPQTTTPFPGFPIGSGTSHQMFFADLNPSIPGFDVIYIVENGSFALSKFSFDQGTGSWVLNGVIGTDADDYKGLTGVVNGTTVTLYATRGIPNTNSPTAAGELVALTDNTGYTLTPNSFTGTPTVIATPGANTFFKGLAMAPQPASISLSTKVFLQGAYNVGLGRHKDVTLAWATLLNANALNQPFGGAPWNYAGTESVSNGFFANTGATTDIVDWVLVELHDATTPSTIVARKACFVREDGKVVDATGNDPSFTGVGANNYYIVIKHRNHLAIRSATTVFVNGAAPVTYDFTTAQSQAYQNGAIVTNPAMKDLTGGGTVFGMWGGNANSNTSTRASGALSTNDYLYLVNILLGGNTATILNTYSPGDLNLDGQVRASGALTTNDYLILVNIILGGNTANIYTEHQ
jgi:hypothetical protein